MVILCISVLSSTNLFADDAQWCNLNLRFVYDGTPPASEISDGVIDVGYSQRLPSEDESLQVNAENRGIENVVLYLVNNEDNTVSAPPNSSSRSHDKVELTIRHGRFEPHVLLIQTGATLVVRNRDNAAYNPGIDFSRNGGWNGLVEAKSSESCTVTQAEPYPVPVTCNIKPFLRGYILVRDSPYMAKSDLDGELRLTKLPIGDLTFQLWHERVGRLRNIRIGSGETDNKGRFTMSLEAGERYISNVILPASLLKRD